MNRVCTRVCTSWPREWDGGLIRAGAGRHHPADDRHYPGVCSGRGRPGCLYSTVLDQQCGTAAWGDLTTPP